MRVAAIEVSHWHSLYDAAYLRILADTPGVELVGLHDPSADVAARRAAAVGDPPVFTDHREMLARTKPDFVVALGQHRRMAATAHDLLDLGVPFMMEKPMGLDAGGWPASPRRRRRSRRSSRCPCPSAAPRS
jgi:predicted dehydrogenase